MKTKIFRCTMLGLTLIGCSIFSNLPDSPASVETNTPEAQQEDQPIDEDWLLADPTFGLAFLASYQQELTIGFQGTKDGVGYEWNNTYQRMFWKDALANFLTLKTNETGVESTETLIGAVDQAHYSRLGAVADCQVKWGELAPDAGLERVLEPAGFLPPINEATEVGTETVNGISAKHYVVSAERAGAKIVGDFWQAQEGGYIVRYALTISGGEDVFGEGREGEQHFTYELSQVDALGEVVYPEGCSAVLMDFPVMEGAQSLRRLPQAVNYAVSVNAEAVSQFYQEQLVAESWEFVKVHDKDPQNLLLTFVNETEKQAVTILIHSQNSGVWVSAIVAPWESTSFQFKMPSP